MPMNWHWTTAIERRNARLLRQKRFHTEAASARLFEFGGLDQHGGQSLLKENGLELPGQTGSDVAAVDHDSISHEVMRLVGIEKVNALPVFVNGRERIGVKSPGED